MELVGAHQVLRLLGDLTLDGGQQLRGDGGIQNVVQHRGELGVLGLLVVGDEAHQMPHQRLGDAGVDGIVAHVVAVVGAPAKGQLTEVAGADDQAAGGVGDIHEHLGALPGLAVFKGDGVVVHIVADVLEVAADTARDVHRPQRAAQPLRQQHRIGLGAVRSAEAGHGDGDDVLRRTVQHLHGQGRDEDGQGGVQSAGKAHHRSLGAGVLHALLESQRRHAQDLAAPLGAALLVLRHKGSGGDVAAQAGGGQVHIKVYPPDLRSIFRSGIGVHPAALGGQLIHVDLADGEPGGKPPLGQQRTVFRDEVVAGEHQIRGGLALAGVGVHVAAHQPSGLARHQRAAVGGLAHGLIGGGQIQNNGSTLPGQRTGGRLRRPQILADLHAHHQIFHAGAAKNSIAAEIHVLAAEGNHVVHTARAARGRKPPLLVKFPVIGQIRLGHQAQDLSFVYYRGTVIQFVVPFVPHGQADGRHHVQIPGGLQNGLQALLGAPEQRILQEEVAAGVAGQAQLRKHDHLHALLVRLAHEGEDLLGVVAAVRHADLGGGSSHGNKSVFHMQNLLQKERSPFSVILHRPAVFYKARG